MSDLSPVPASDAPPAPSISIWSAETLREQLGSDEAPARLRALAMAVQPAAPLDACVEDVVKCVAISADDPLAQKIAAIALGGTNVSPVPPSVLECLSRLAAPDHDVQVRIAAAHSLYRLKQVPQSALPGLSDLLLDPDSSARKVAALALSIAGIDSASEIAKKMAAVSPDQWSTEGIAALAHSAGDTTERKRSVEQFIVRGMAAQPLLPTGIAAFAALAKLNPGGPSLNALVTVAVQSTDALHRQAALDALSSLGENARSAIPDLVKSLVATDEPEREEGICRVLLPLRLQANDVPLPRVLNRIERAPDRAVAAHCLLLSLHAKSFTSAAKVVAARFATSGEALQRVLDEVHHQLVGKRLVALQPLAATSQTP